MWIRRWGDWQVKMAPMPRVSPGRIGTLTTLSCIGEDPGFDMSQSRMPHQLWIVILKFAGWWHSGVVVSSRRGFACRDYNFHSVYVSKLVERLMLLLAWSRHRK